MMRVLDSGSKVWFNGDMNATKTQITAARDSLIATARYSEDLT
jgi:hypothetical protein